MRININTKICAVFLIFLIELLLLLFVYEEVNTEYEYYVNELKEEIVEIKLINQLQLGFSQAGMPLNDLLITGKVQDEKGNFALINKKVEGLISVLDLWFFDDEKEKEAFNKIKEDYFRFKELALKIFTIHNPVGNSEARQIMEKADKITYEAVFGLKSFHEFASREISGINANQLRLKNKINLVVLFGVLFSMTLVLAALLYFRATIYLPLINLKGAALEVGKGNLDKKVNIRLEDEIGELGREFNKMTEGLKAAQAQLIKAEKMDLVSKLASGVAHEVRNPLSVILQGIDYLSQTAFGKEEVYSSALNDMAEAVKKADVTINSLLDFASTRKLDIKLVDINFIVEKSLLLVKYQMEKSNVTAFTELKKDIPNILADKNKIEQAFVNFFANAIESMPRGGQLKIKTYSKQVTEVIEDPHYRKGKNVKFTEQLVIAEIEDTGTGIPEEVISKIFTPFFSTKGERGNSGLGLWIVRNIIEMHNGKMEIENKKDGNGVKVTIVFKV